MPIYLAVRAAVLSLATAALVLTMLVLVRSQQPLVIVVQAPAASTAHVFDTLSPVQWTNCWGYDRWNRPPADLRWWCGID